MKAPRIQDITLELLQKCHQECRYCSSNSSQDQTTQLDFKVVKKTIDNFYALGGKVVELSGGEPLSYDFINETIEYLASKDLEIHLFTCCYVPDKEINWDIVRKVDRVYVNLQAPNKEIHDYLTNNEGSFDRVINFIRKCKEYQLWVGTHIIPLPHNINEIDDYVKLAEYLEIDNVSLLRYVEQGRGTNQLELNDEEILQLHHIITKYQNRENKVEFKIGCPLDFQFIYKRRKEAKPCVSAKKRCVVRPNGNVIPCPAYKDDPEFVGGNVNKTSFKEIWEKSEIFIKIRNFDQNKLVGFCSKCSFLDIWKGRCHAQRIHHHGKLSLSPDPYCPIYINQKKPQV